MIPAGFRYGGVAAGEGLGAAAEARAHDAMGAGEYEIVVDVREGTGRAVIITWDLAAEYVKINTDYRS